VGVWGRLRGGGGVVGGGGGGGGREDDGDWSAWPLFLSGTRRSEGDAVWPLDFLWAQRRLWLVCAGLVYSAGRFLLGARWDKDEASWVGYWDGRRAYTQRVNRGSSQTCGALPACVVRTCVLTLIRVTRPVHFTYQPPANNSFLSEQTNHQPPAKRADR
jgi:hypothetical protein